MLVSACGTGDRMIDLTRDFHVTRADLVAYANASGDQNPIHQDEKFAQSVGLPGVIAHGMFTMGLVGTVLTDFAGPASVVDFQVRFTRPVVVGVEGADVLITVTEKSRENDLVSVDIAAVFEGQTVLSKASAVLRLP